ncbi:hypothetical protein N7451_004435 [Penicillium sp. IBT 35674x]|nr:hypothetical protein N7451_004435 [Penicillium sp. IBT 35674x]
MSRENISFKTSDNVTLRGWFYKNAKAQTPLPCLVMAHGLACLKEFDLDTFAEYFVAHLDISCLVYDHRGFGESDTKDGQPRQEIIPAQQTSDYSDAITYAQSRSDVNENKIGIWGSSLSGGHALWVGAVDRRVKAVLSQVPIVDGWRNMDCLMRPDAMGALNESFQKDRLARADGKDATTIPVVDIDPLKPSVLPTPDSFKFYNHWAQQSSWENKVTLKSVEAFRAYEPAAHISHIAPTPLLMTIAQEDVVTPTSLALEAYSKALEPKTIHFLPDGHFDAYSGPNFSKNASFQAQFLKDHLCV